MKLTFATFALLATVNGIQFKEEDIPQQLPEVKEEDIPQQLPEIELESEAHTAKMDDELFELHRWNAKENKKLPPRSVMRQLSRH